MTSEKRVARWYFGGLASAGAACCTHPLDLLKVHLQTATTKGSKQGLIGNTLLIVKNQGILALYNGLSASLMRQLTYSTTRFGIYEVGKQGLSKPGEQMPFYQRVILAGMSGAAGGLVGTPADMINVRMQNDIKLPLDSRRNYKHAIDGLIQVYTREGPTKLFNGASMATSRAIMMTIGQVITGLV